VTDHVLKLYVTGHHSERSSRAISNWRKFCDEEMSSVNCVLEIIDSLENPQAAEDAKIFATPTLVKHEPPPPRRIIGDLADRSQVLRMLNIELHREKPVGT
jgi:circadian clock protein KaiB